MQLRDVKKDEAVWTQTVGFGAMCHSSFSSDGTLIISGDADGGIVIRDAATGAARQTLLAGSCKPVADLALSPDKRHIAHIEDAWAGFNLWDLDKPLPAPRRASQTVFREIASIQAFGWSGDRLRAVSTVNGPAEKDLRVILIHTWDAATGVAALQKIPETHLMEGAALSPDGRLLAIVLRTQPGPESSRTEGVGIYDLGEGKLLRVLPEEFDISCLAWSPDSRILATNPSDSNVKLWDVAAGKVQRVLETQAAVVAWSADGSTIAVGSDNMSGGGQVRLFDSAAGIEKQSWEARGGVQLLAFAPDGKTLAAGLMLGPQFKPDRGMVRLFDVATGRKKREFTVQIALRSLHWTPDGSGIAAIGDPDAFLPFNDRLRMWDAATGAERIAIDDHCGLGEFAFSPNGKSIAAFNWSRVQVWDVK